MAWTRSIIGTFFWLVMFLAVAWGATVAFLMWQQNNEVRRAEILSNYYIAVYESAERIMNDLSAMGEAAYAADGAISPALRQEMSDQLYLIAQQLNKIKSAEERYGDGESGTYRRLLSENRNFDEAMTALLTKAVFDDGMLSAMQQFRNRVEQFYLLRTNQFLSVRDEGRAAADTGRRNALYFLAVVLVIGVLAVRYAKREIETIAARNRASEQALRDGEARYRALIESGTVAVLVFDEQYRPLYASPLLAEIFGYDTPDEILAMNDMSPLLAENEIARLTESRDRRFAGKNPPTQFEFQGLRKDGTPIWVSQHSSLITWNGGKALLSTMIDITERELAEKSLRESEMRYRRLVERMNEGLGELDRDMRITYVNNHFCQMLGYSREEMMHRLITDFLDPENKAVMNAERNNRVGGSTRVYEINWTRKTGSKVHTLVAPEPLYDESGEFAGSLAVFTDITELKRQSELLQESERRFRSLAEAGAVGIWQIDTNDRTLYVNPAMCNILGVGGLDDFNSKPSLEFFTPRAAAQVTQERSKRVDGAATTYETELRRPDGEVRSVLISGSPLFLDDGTLHSTIGSVIDSTERQALEERLRRSQKMEAVGQLTGGIAHEFNNLLQVVLGNLELLEAAAPANDAMDRRFQAIHRNITRGAELTDRLLSFSRQQPLAPKAIKIPRVLAEMQDMLVQTLGETITVAVDSVTDVWMAEADPGQLENALLNLALNARDAMPAGGAITLSAANITIDEAAAANEEDRRAGDYVVLCVADEGGGMSEEARTHAFEPFFTTKEVGKGTGLGLSMVYGFAQQSGGFTEIESEVGRRTAVRIYLPRLATSAGDAADAADGMLANRAGVASESLDRRTILLVEDDADVRASLSDQMDDLGYRVIEAEDGHGALALLDGTEHIDLLFTDFVMPGGLNGLDLARRVRERKPGLTVIYTTGYSDDILARAGPLDDGAVVLRKPYNSKAMAAALERAMES